VRLEVSGLVRSFGRARVLRGVNAVFEPGSIYAVVGPNGSGKTTLLRVLAGLCGFERGELRYGEHHVGPGGHAPWEIRRTIGLLGHGSFCYADLTGRENLELYASLWAEPFERVAEALARFGLGHAADRPVDTYSRGMVQRTALARLWLQEPHFLLFDEPMTGLDADMRARLTLDLRAAAEAGAVVVVVTHDPLAVSELGAATLCLSRGRLEASREAEA
jgi:heme exporter protein A